MAEAVLSWFFEIALVFISICVCVCVCVCVCMFMCVCVSTLEGINNQWHDMMCYIGHVRLVKQVLWLFPALNYFI